MGRALRAFPLLIDPTLWRLPLPSRLSNPISYCAFTTINHPVLPTYTIHTLPTVALLSTLHCSSLFASSTVALLSSVHRGR